MRLPNPDFWRGRRVLVTGHTGFKGAWLSLWLARMGAWVTGYALRPEHSAGIYMVSGLARQITSVIGDIRDSTQFRQCLRLMRPEIVFHLAAQSLVRRAHAQPVLTYDVNVLGTSKVLDEVSRFSFTRALVAVTSDKVYDNTGGDRKFVETDRLGGHEPYGASKAAAELVIESYRHGLGANSRLGLASVRAGNVIGGGDWAEDRLVPDAMHAFINDAALPVRNPNATRPWQYVLDPLCGYLLLAENLAEDRSPRWRSAWNFGPDDSAPVREVADQVTALWNGADGDAARWETVREEGAPYEARTLGVDSTKARKALNWQPRFGLDRTLQETVRWYRAGARGEDMAAVSGAALGTYLETHEPGRILTTREDLRDF